MIISFCRHIENVAFYWVFAKNRSHSSFLILHPISHFIMLLGFAFGFGLCIRKTSLLLKNVTIPALQTIWMADSAQTLENVFCFISIWCVGFHKHHEIDWHIGNLTYLLNIAFVGNDRGCKDVVF